MVLKSNPSKTRKCLTPVSGTILSPRNCQWGVENFAFRDKPGATRPFRS